MSTRFQALRVVLFGLLAGAFCSGCDPNMGSPNGGPSAGMAGADETPDEGTGPAAGGTGGASPTGGATSYGGTESVPPAGSAGVPPTGGSSSGGESPAGAAGVIAQGGNYASGGQAEAGAPATGGYCCHQGGTEQTGGDSGMSGQAGEPATGGNLGTGGQTETGGEAGEPATGGTVQTGGNSGMGGEAGELATGGTVQTGGNSGMGGEAGEPATGGEGGDGEDGPYCVSPGEACDESLDGRRQCCAEKDGDVVECVDGICTLIPQPFACGAWTSDADFAAYAYDSTDGLWASAQDNVYVAAGYIGGPGKLVHYDGSSWSEVMLPDTYPIYRMFSVYGDGNGIVWAGGNWNSGGVVPYAMLIKLQDGDWQAETVQPMVTDVEAVRSIWAGDGVVVVSADIQDSSVNWDSYIYIKQGETWIKTQTPLHQVPFRILKVWGRSANEIYAVGGKLEVENNSIAGWMEAVLWRYNGSSWSEVTTPPTDFTYFSDVHGNADGEIYVSGVARYNENGRGAILVSTDLVNWTRHDVAFLTAADSVATLRAGAAIAGLWMSDSPISGDARISVSSEWSWNSPEHFSSAVNYVNGIVFVPDSNEVIFTATTGSDGTGNVFRSTCQ
jgi:hypothetical protein